MPEPADRGRRALGIGPAATRVILEVLEHGFYSDACIYTDTAIAHARLAAIPAARVINCWELPTLLDWLADRRHADR